MSATILRPTADHAKAWEEPASGTHFDDVDEAVADDDTTFVATALKNNDDVFTIDAAAIPADAVISLVTVTIRARFIPIVEDVDAMMDVIVGNDGLTKRTEFGPVVIFGPYEDFAIDFPTNASSVPWTRANLNTLKAGVGSGNLPGVGDVVRCTQLFVTVTYTQPSQAKKSGRLSVAGSLFLSP